MSTDLDARMAALIDGADHDWEVSGDAMRWTPDGSRPTSSGDVHVARPVVLHLDVSAAVRALQGLAEIIREFDRCMSSPAGVGLKQALAAIEDAQQRAAQRRVHVAYRARQIARRRRNRG